MEHDLVLEGKVVRPSGIEETMIGVSEGRIAELGRQVRGARHLRADRCLVFPGFIDMHVHLREPGWEYKEGFRSGSKAAIHGGVTTMADMPNNLVPATSGPVIDEKRRLAESRGLVDIRLYGGVEQGRLDLIEKISSKVVGYKIYLAETMGSAPFPDASLDEALGAIEKVGRPVSFHCEDQTIIDQRERELAGVERPDLWCDLRPPEAEVASATKVAEAIRTKKELRGNICHASTEKTLRVVSEARQSGLDLQCEATLHHLFYNRRAMIKSRLLRTNPPLRSEADRGALVRGLENETVSFLVTDHAPHTEQEKLERGLSGIPGLDDFSHLVTWLIKDQGVPPETICKAASSNPAEYAGLADRGEIAVGKRADFSIVDLNSPETMDSELVQSKCGWSPYEGIEFPGRARWTLRDGEVLLDDFELVV